MRSHLNLCIVALLTIALAFPVGAAKLAGVSLSDSAKVGDHDLVLNGLGLRKKAIFKVYVGGLYLPEKSSDADAIQKANAPWRVVMHFVRSVDKDALCGGWDDGLANNTASASVEVKADFKKLCEWMEDVENKDELAFTYEPGQGVEVQVKGKSKGTLDNEDSAAALLACWLGPKPPSDDFKEGLLGK